MLVLSRRVDEQIVIGEDIVIRVLGIEGSGVVRLGVEAPAQYRILRGELVDEIAAANRAALVEGGSTLPDLSGLAAGGETQPPAADGAAAG